MVAPTLTDEEAARLVQAGHSDQYGLLIERYEGKLKRYGRKFLMWDEDIEDLVQDVFIKAYQNMQSFDATQRFSPWVYRIAHNTFVSELKRRSRNPLVYMSFDTLALFGDHHDEHLAQSEAAATKERIECGMERLSPQYREVLVLYYIEEMSYKDIATVLHTPQSTVGVRLRRAREALKKEYEKTPDTL